MIQFAKNSISSSRDLYHETHNVIIHNNLLVKVTIHKHIIVKYENYDTCIIWESFCNLVFVKVSTHYVLIML